MTSLTKVPKIEDFDPKRDFVLKIAAKWQFGGLRRQHLVEAIGSIESNE